METKQLETARNAFNLRKANELTMISDEGKAEQRKVEKLQADNATLKQDTADKLERQVMLWVEINDAKNTIALLEKKPGDYMFISSYPVLGERRAILEREINELKMGSTEAVKAIKQEIDGIDTQISECESTIARIQQRENGQKRIEELKIQEQQLAREYERLESELFLCETFVKTKVGLLEARVNGMFEFTRWKLFEELINGGISEVCEATVDGVPYSSGLNNGMRIASGMDCIKVLQKHYNFAAPIWIDNAEAFCHLPEMNCQVVKLFVSGQDKELRVERT